MNQNVIFDEECQINGRRACEFVKKCAYVREAGTEQEVRTAEALMEELASAGLAGRVEPFRFRQKKVLEEKLIVTKPYEKGYDIISVLNCENTPPEGIVAPLLYVEYGDEISLSHARGKIVLVNGPVKKEKYECLLEAGVVGFLEIRGTPIDKMEDRKEMSPRIHQVDQPSIPCGAVHYLDALELVEHHAEEVRLVVRQDEVTGDSQNVAVRIEGSDRAEEILTLTAHYDSVPQGPGAYDNLSGAAIILELARYFACHPPRRTLEFIWFGAEEKGLLGSLSYMEQHEKELPRHRFNMNVDLAGQRLGGTVFGVTAGEEVCETIKSIMRKADMGMIVSRSVWASDSNSFAWKGIPATTMGRDGFGMHTRYDTIALISAEALESGAKMLGWIAWTLSMADEMPFAREVPEEFGKELEERFGSVVSVSYVS
ncbi:MAG: M28 family metallopeptidase [Fusicatenibacter sp.]